MGYILNPHRFGSAGGAGAPIPSGLIIPFNDVAANITSGWSQFTSPSNRAILGTKTLSEVGNTGGSTYFSKSMGTSGTHTGTGASWWFTSVTGSCIADTRGFGAGNHGHTCRINYTPARRYQVLMKATQGHDQFPAKTAALSVLSQSANGLTDVTPNGYLLYGTSNSSSSSSSLSKSMSNISSGGVHDHIAGCGPTVSGGSGWSTNYNQGNHNNHSGTPSITDNMYRVYMSMWTHASQAFDASSGMYALWESLTAPEGWDICDGTNGTPDLTNYMIGLTTTSSNWGTRVGTGQISLTGFYTTYGGSHSHHGSYASRGTVVTGYHTNSQTHRHLVGSSTVSYYPQYYKLVIIKVSSS